MTDKPNCYECKHRGKVPGSAHCSCNHPKNGRALESPLGKMLEILGAGDPVETGLNVRGSRHGIQMGWFAWPFNFDPVWLERCDGFEAKEEQQEESK